MFFADKEELAKHYNISKSYYEIIQYTLLQNINKLTESEFIIQA
nr:MAG TPA: hypothetical protein [Caudoviricetes sp.]